VGWSEPDRVSGRSDSDSTCVSESLGGAHERCACLRLCCNHSGAQCDRNRTGRTPRCSRSPQVTTWQRCPTGKTRGLSSQSLSLPLTRGGGRFSRHRTRLCSTIPPLTPCLSDRRSCTTTTSQIPPSARTATVHYPLITRAEKTPKIVQPTTFSYWRSRMRLPPDRRHHPSSNPCLLRRRTRPSL